MALTRRTARFREIAEQADALLRQQDAEIDSRKVDALLRARIAHVADRMGIGERSALTYAPEDLPSTIASDLRTASDRPRLRSVD